ncbi:A24 family peptidase [Desulfotomaculum varum]
MEIYVLWFILGLITGSFLNVCIVRVPLGQSVVTSPSHCFSCGTRLRPRDLIPLASFIILRGKCRYCGAGIAWHYPVVELTGGLLFTAVMYYWGLSWQAAAMLVFFSLLLVVAVIDLQHQIIPDGILLAGALLGIPFLYLQGPALLKDGMAGLLAAGILMLAIALLARGGMGGGDIKLAAVMGLFLGLKQVAVALLIAFLLGGTTGLILLATGRKGRKDPIPFGPFLALGSLIAAVAGEQLAAWYINLLS